VRKELYNPLISLAKTHFTLQITENSLSKRKILKNLAVLQENQKKIEEKELFIKEFYDKLPKEFINKNIENTGNIKKNPKKISFLPYCMMKLEDFERINEGFVKKTKENGEICEVLSRIFERKSNEKSRKIINKNRGFLATNLTTIIEHLHYK